MKRCCETEAKKHVRRHRDVAVCDACRRLLLGYDNEAEWKKTQDELARNKVPFEAAKLGALWVVSKERAPEGAFDDEGDEDDEDDED